jgi:multiple sugar transport system permease protein
MRLIAFVTRLSGGSSVLMTKQQWGELRVGLAFISPWVIGFIWFNLYPVLASVYYSFTSFHVVENPQWVGLNNFNTLAKDELFWTSLVNTAYYIVGSVPLDLIAALFFAVLLNLRLPLRAFLRTCYYVPTIVPTVAGAILWIMLFNTHGGIINQTLGLIGIDEVPWLSSPNWAMPALILLSVWGIGSAVIIFLAGLQDVPATLYEAAQLDGAGWFRLVWHVTIPLVSPVILFNGILGMIGASQVFAQPFIMTGGGPLNATLMYSITLFRNAFVYYKMGYASAMAWILFIFLFALTLLSLRLSQRYVHYE